MDLWSRTAKMWRDWNLVQEFNKEGKVCFAGYEEWQTHSRKVKIQ